MKQQILINISILSDLVVQLSETVANSDTQLQQSHAQIQQFKAKVNELQNKLQTEQTSIQDKKTQLAVCQQQSVQNELRLKEVESQLSEIKVSINSEQNDSTATAPSLLEKQLNELVSKHSLQQQDLTLTRQQQSQLRDKVASINETQKQSLQKQETLVQQISELKLKREGVKGQINSQLEILKEERVDVQTVAADLDDNANIDHWHQELDKVKQRIARLGAINLTAIEEFEQQKERKDYLDKQNDDLTTALESLESAIKKIDRETRSRFKETYEKVNNDLQILFPKVFGGGSAYLELTDDDLLETGITIMARPPGKKNSTIHLLSGGEKALTALSLVFAIFRLNPAPFCMLDEVDAPLDDANVERFCRLLEEMSQTVQFIYISHNKITMEMADQLIGVTMHEPGVSRIVAVDVDEAVALADVG